jgi:DNA-binding CsgD family transcriptional regulator
VAAQVDVVLPYLSRAFEIDRRLTLAAAQSRANEAILDRVPFGLFQLDSKGTVVSANAHATRMAKQRKGLTVTANGVHAAASGDEARLQRAITEVLASDGASSRRVSVSCGADAAPYSVLVSGIAPNSIALSARTTCVLFVTDPETQPSPSAQAIVQAFGLTPAEARIASGLATGVSLPATAANLGISINTARTLLSRAMAKTSTNSQLGLVRLVLTGLTLVHVDE